MRRLGPERTNCSLLQELNFYFQSTRRYGISSWLSAIAEEPARCFFGVVRDDKACARPFDAGKDLEDDAPFVYPTRGARRLHHRVFAADVIRGDGHVELLRSPRQHIEVRECRL